MLPKTGIKALKKNVYMLKIMIKDFKKINNKYRKLHLVKIIKMGESKSKRIALFSRLKTSVKHFQLGSLPLIDSPLLLMAAFP